jgi:hypothetical protein
MADRNPQQIMSEWLAGCSALFLRVLARRGDSATVYAFARQIYG